MQTIALRIRDQRGFTLIEIIMVIVLLGIIAAIAIPKYVDLRSEAQTATVKGLAGSIISSAAIGYADMVAKNTANRFPTAGELNDTYLKLSGVPYGFESTRWTASIGGDIYYLTYDPNSGNATYGQ